MQTLEQLTFDELASRYCERQELTKEELQKALQFQCESFNPDGWMLLRCELMDSLVFGSLAILAYGPACTYKTVPTHPVSPRGLASDMSVVIAVMPKENLPSV